MFIQFLSSFENMDSLFSHWDHNEATDLPSFSFGTMLYTIDLHVDLMDMNKVVCIINIFNTSSYAAV